MYALLTSPSRYTQTEPNNTCSAAHTVLGQVCAKAFLSAVAPMPSDGEKVIRKLAVTRETPHSTNTRSFLCKIALRMLIAQERSRANGSAQVLRPSVTIRRRKALFVSLGTLSHRWGASSETERLEREVAAITTARENINYIIVALVISQRCLRRPEEEETATGCHHALRANAQRRGTTGNAVYDPQFFLGATPFHQLCSETLPGVGRQK